MIALPLVIAGGLLYAGFKSVQQLKQKKETGDHPAIGLMNKADRICQRFIQQKIDPLLTGSSRQTQLAKLKDNNTALPAPSEQEQKVNRLIALSGVTMGLAVINKYLFPPLLILTAASGIYLMLPLYQKTFKHLKEGKVKMDLLDSLYLTGFWFAGYYIFAGFAYLLYYIGVKLIHQMESRSRENLTNLFGQQPCFVWQLVDGIEVQTPLAALHAGDVVVVNAGEPLPVDGVVIEGLGSVDQHMLTGESQPVDKEAGEPVFTSTLLLSGRLFIRVEKTGENTLTAKISEILSQTAKYQAEMELKGQQLADKTVLPNLAVSLLALPIVGPAGAVATLGAGFGFNMRLVSLLGIMNYLTIASRHNILVKDGRALERLKDVDTIVFDKTGTLTLEQPHLVQIHVVQAGLSEADLLGCAATAEHRQPHPIAKAIIHAAEEQGLKLPEIEKANYEVGYGIKVRVKGKLIRVGSSRFITREGLTIPARIETLQAACQVQGFALVQVAIDEQVAGALELHATIRPEAGQMIQDLHKRNLSIAILSGDQEQPTKKLAAELGIDKYYADTLPENKAGIIKQLQAEGRVVCFIGDGINDAIALKQADVSISLLGATSIATDTAQIVLMDRSLKQLGYLLALSDKFDKTLQTAFLTTLVPGCICIGGVFVAGFGIISAEILFQLGFFSGLAVAMRPLFTEGKHDEELLTNQEP